MSDRFTNSFSYETWYQKYKFAGDESVEDKFSCSIYSLKALIVVKFF